MIDPIYLSYSGTCVTTYAMVGTFLFHPDTDLTQVSHYTEGTLDVPVIINIITVLFGNIVRVIITGYQVSHVGKYETVGLGLIRFFTLSFAWSVMR